MAVIYLLYSQLYQPHLINDIESKDADSINSNELAKLLKYDNSEIILFDLRNIEDYNKGHIPGAKQYNTSEIESKIGDLSYNKINIFYANESNESYEIVKKVRNYGYQCYYLEGGWDGGWEPYLKDICSTCGGSSIKSMLIKIFS